METYKVQDNKVRIDAYIHKHILKDLSKTKIQTLIENGDITVKDQPTPLKISYKLKMNEEIIINKNKLKEKDESTIKEENISLNIVFEDETLLVVNKASGMIVHPTEGKEDSGTLVNALLHHVGIDHLSYPKTNRPGIVHRIDKFTSGLLVVAKDDESHEFLKKQLEEHTMKRKYIGLVINHLNDEKGTIDLPIGHSATLHLQKMGAYSTAKDAKNAKEAVTHYKLIQNYQMKNKKFSLVEFQLETGRTHQISEKFC
jgi:23S rRNA pseudouridine1911/1915/1917 synthase